MKQGIPDAKVMANGASDSQIMDKRFATKLELLARTAWAG